MEKYKERKKAKHAVILILIVLFFYDVYKFMNAEGKEHPVIEVLFNMIIILASLMFLHHKKEIMEESKGIIGQTYLENYFRKDKKN